jgi:glycosyltransferase involved in cell wall biosynthesis
MDVEPERVSVLQPGVEGRFAPVKDAGILRAVQRKYQLPERFVMGLGTLQPRKNFDGLVKAFGQLVRDMSEFRPSQSMHLVIAGGKGWMSEDIVQSVSDLRLEQRVHFPGFVNDEDLPALYSLAEVFAFPSWYEGFGLPVLEAMACGTPVVAADNSSLPEAVGEAGILVPADDLSALAGALADLVTDESLRASLVPAGQAQAKRFTWEAAARQLLQEYESLGQ